RTAREELLLRRADLEAAHAVSHDDARPEPARPERVDRLDDDGDVVVDAQVSEESRREDGDRALAVSGQVELDDALDQELRAASREEGVGQRVPAFASLREAVDGE